MPDQPQNFAGLYRQTVEPLRRFLRRMTSNPADAQDLAQEAYARVYRAMDRTKVEKPEAFLYTTARRLALKQLRRRRISPINPDSDNLVELVPANTPDVTQIVMARQEWDRMQAVIAALPPGCRTVLELLKLEGLSHAEAAARLGISVSTIEKQHARALRLIRAALPDDEPAGDLSNHATSKAQ